MDPGIATCILNGIFVDTDSFKNPNTSTATLRITSYLLSQELYGTRAVGVVDVTGGYGASVYDLSKSNARVIPFNFASAAKRTLGSGKQEPVTDRTGQLTFVNKRAWMYWNMREVLDPINGDNVVLPDDPELKADLTAPRFMVRSNGIQIESKEDIKTRLGRSPDKGDAACLAFVPVIVPSIPTEQPEQSSRFLSEYDDGQSKFKGRF